MNTQDEEWWRNNWILIPALLLVPPLGLLIVYMRWGVKTAAGATVALLLFTAVYGSGEESGDKESTAYVMCQEFVESRLKSPSSAEFPWKSEIKVKSLDDHTYAVSGYVDAQNSFGANVRQNYVCKVKYDGGDEWQLIGLSL